MLFPIAANPLLHLSTQTLFCQKLVGEQTKQVYLFSQVSHPALQGSHTSPLAKYLAGHFSKHFPFNRNIPT
jgi:hypothetical protein